MYSAVKVIELKNDGTVLVGCSTEACNGCKAEMFCNNKAHSNYLARNDKKIPVQPGDFVEVFLPPGKTILSTFIVFAIPLLLFPLGYILATSLFRFSELYGALAGLASMSLAFIISSFISFKNKKALMPVITKSL